MKQLFFALTLIVSILIGGCGNSNSSEQLSIEQFTLVLESRGMSLGKKTEKMFGLLMAVDGYGIEINGDTIEIYQFDTTIKSGREALDKWQNEGIRGVKPIVRKNLMLAPDKKHPNWSEIKDIFLGM